MKLTLLTGLKLVALMLEVPFWAVEVLVNLDPIWAVEAPILEAAEVDLIMAAAASLPEVVGLKNVRCKIR